MTGLCRVYGSFDTIETPLRWRAVHTDINVRVVVLYTLRFLCRLSRPHLQKMRSKKSFIEKKLNGGF
jgi:hypothetical protein